MQLVGQVTTAIVTATVNAGAESIVAQLGNVIPSRDGQSLLLLGFLAGAINAQTAYTLNIRRGALVTSPVVATTGVLNAAGVAGIGAVYTLHGGDIVTGFGPVQYCLSYLPVGANTTVVGVALTAILL
jgi:hypothetical protein